MAERGTIYRDIEQGTPEWLNLRLGCVTASRIADMLAQTKNGWGSSRANYAAELICERLTGKSPERFKSAAMDFGNATEDEARQAYLYANNIFESEQVAFVSHPRIGFAGCSPDTLVGSDGGVEIKCPNPATHIETLLGKKIPDRYFKQVTWTLACTGREWWDFVSYCPDLPIEMRTFRQRITRNETVIYQYEAETEAFLAEIDVRIADLVKAYPAKEAA